jgi:hypothetical protein
VLLQLDLLVAVQEVSCSNSHAKISFAAVAHIFMTIDFIHSVSFLSFLLCRAGGAFGADGDASIFDPVRQKSLADQSFDLGVSSYFPEEDRISRGQSQSQGGFVLDDEDEEGPVDAPYDPEDDDGSVGDGAGFELQEDQFTDEGHGIDQSLLYTIHFNAPTQFGMLLEVSEYLL